MAEAPEAILKALRGLPHPRGGRMGGWEKPRSFIPWWSRHIGVHFWTCIMWERNKSLASWSQHIFLNLLPTKYNYWLIDLDFGLFNPQDTKGKSNVLMGKIPAHNERRNGRTESPNNTGCWPTDPRQQKLAPHHNGKQRFSSQKTLSGQDNSLNKLYLVWKFGFGLQLYISLKYLDFVPNITLFHI